MNKQEKELERNLWEDKLLLMDKQSTFWLI